MNIHAALSVLEEEDIHIPKNKAKFSIFSKSAVISKANS